MYRFTVILLNQVYVDASILTIQTYPPYNQIRRSEIQFFFIRLFDLGWHLQMSWGRLGLGLYKFKFIRSPTIRKISKKKVVRVKVGCKMIDYNACQLQVRQVRYQNLIQSLDSVMLGLPNLCSIRD